ncbi:lycopene cyclase domain-containing protein [Corynebacterium guangdongense]|uniref:Lycopene cyclase domain-containing protein n=1 Tax=Corynebacterium guangdongense TaxID=1783348 RepID=A0ABU2A090_9CORY|nr:lycopene cyclase domain-containing protein [Corynebacterium guangdongense]MDR7330608.1 lycopene cyclase domain-containing protein [Corynebacterium guangdongense]WJZ16625.1 hypothetical protein CGUA_00065 [Corynebacterium guangdongense]
MTYLLISLPFLLVSVIVWLARFRKYPRQGAVTLIVLGVVGVLTIIFDNLMILFGNFAYGDDQNLGIFIGVMPIEDLTYPLFASLIITSFWPGKDRT